MLNKKNCKYKCLSAIRWPTGLLSALEKLTADVALSVALWTVVAGCCRRRESLSAPGRLTGANRADWVVGQ